MREERERRTDFENYVPENTQKKAVAPGKSAFYMLGIQKYYVFFFFIKGDKCETLFPVFFCKFLSKNRHLGSY